MVAEIALALLLLAGAGLLMRSFERLTSVNPGFTTERLLTMRIFTAPAKYSDARKRSQYVDNILSEVRKTPGVEAAGSVHFLPLSGSTSGSCFAPAPGPQPDVSSPGAQFLIAGAGYFQTMRTPLLSGRDFNEQDSFGSRSVLIVNHAFAQRFFPGRNPIGTSLNVCWTVPNPVKIVGIVADARQTELQTPPEPTIFLANSQAPMYFARLVVRTRSDPRQLSRAVEAAIHRVDPDQAVSDVETMEEAVRRFGFPAAISTGSAVGVRGHGGAAGGHRNIWRSLLFGQPADAGDRDSGGSGRARRQRIAAGAGGGAAAERPGSGRGPGGGDRVHARAAQPAV